MYIYFFKFYFAQTLPRSRERACRYHNLRAMTHGQLIAHFRDTARTSRSDKRARDRTVILRYI